MYSLALAAILLFVYWLCHIVGIVYRRWSFRTFVSKTKSTYPRPMLNQARLPFGIDHKLRLMLAKKPEDVFGKYYNQKYDLSGPTHGIYDTYGSLKAVHSIDPRNLKAVLSTSFGDWTVSKSRRNVLRPLAQGGVLTTEGAEWLHNRKFFQRHLNTPKARDMRDAEPDVQLLFQAVGPHREDGWSVREASMSELLQRLTLDLSTKFLFGMSAGAQKAGMKGMEASPSPEEQTALEAAMVKYTNALQLIRTYVTARGAMGSGYWMVDSFEYRRACKDLQDFAEQLVADATRDPNAAGLMTQMYADLHDPVQVRDNLLELVLGGQNMTSSILEWILAELARRPAVYERLREEVTSTFGCEGADRVEMTWDNLKKCSLLQNIINETLRCYPTLANISKTAAKDTLLPNGGGHDGDVPVAVPEGATFTCNVFLLHRCKSIWGGDAWEWNPDRWIDRRVGPEFAPFGGGPRICVGRQMSLTQISFIMARFVQQFDAIKAPADANNLAMQYRPVLAPRKVRLFLRSNRGVGKYDA